jgi:hypothetical protein
MMSVSIGTPSLIVALGNALDADPTGDAKSYAFMNTKSSTFFLESGWTYCCYGNQAKAMENLEKRVDPETLAPKIAQSAMGRVETINIMVLSSLKTKERDMEQTVHFWVAGMEGAKALQNQQRSRKNEKQDRRLPFGAIITLGGMVPQGA